MSQNEPFEQALAIVKTGTKKAIFETWFSRLECLKIADGVITIGTPNRFVKEWIEESELIQTLVAALETTYGETLTPSLVITERDEEKLSESGLVVRSEALLDPEAPAPAAPVLEETSSGRHSCGAAPDEGWSVPLKKDYIFANYIVGPSNRLSHAAALAVAQNPGQAYNPLFVHSASGLGKTHLLQAICATVIDQPEQRSILYLSCEDFVNQFIEAVKDGQLEGFRYKYRYVDMLLIDDIHFLADKPRIQEEFFHTFNTLYNGQKQIVLSADCQPSEIPTLNDRLVSRFKWGLVSRIDPPTFETRAAIILKKCGLRGYPLDDEVVNLLATRITTNVREAEGALNRLIGSARLLNRNIDMSFALEVLSDLLGEVPAPVSIEDIVRVASEQSEIKLSDLRSKKRTKKIALTRQICMYLARDLTELTLQEIGKYFGGRDHTTVLYGIEKIHKARGDDSELEDTIEDLRRAARGRALKKPARA